MVAGLRIGSRPYRECAILDKGVGSVPDFADSVPDFAELQLQERIRPLPEAILTTQRILCGATGSREIFT